MACLACSHDSVYAFSFKYLVNLCDNTQLRNECAAAVLGRPCNYVGIWLWYSTEWMAAKDLYMILATRAMAYYPYTWSKSYWLLHESLEASFLTKTLHEYDMAAIQRQISTTM